MAELAAQVQGASQQSVTLAYVDQVYTSQASAEGTQENDMALEVAKLPEAKRGFALLPRR